MFPLVHMLTWYIFFEYPFFVSHIGPYRGRSRAAVTAKMERFGIVVNGFQPLTIIAKRFILDVEAVLDPSLLYASWNQREISLIQGDFKK